MRGEGFGSPPALPKGHHGEKPQVRIDSRRPITVSVPGHSVHQFAPGDSVETDDPAVVAAFEANPDLSQVKAKKTK